MNAEARTVNARRAQPGALINPLNSAKSRFWPGFGQAPVALNCAPGQRAR